jgi:hypothetical protein
LHGLQAEAAQGLHGLQAEAAQGLHGLQALWTTSRGTTQAAAQGLQGLQAAAQGLHGLQAEAAQGLHGLQAEAAQGLSAAAIWKAAWEADCASLPTTATPTPIPITSGINVVDRSLYLNVMIGYLT